jgi:hypothetical protein
VWAASSEEHRAAFFCRWGDLEVVASPVETARVATRAPSWPRAAAQAQIRYQPAQATGAGPRGAPQLDGAVRAALRLPAAAFHLQLRNSRPARHTPHCWAAGPLGRRTPHEARFACGYMRAAFVGVSRCSLFDFVVRLAWLPRPRYGRTGQCVCALASIYSTRCLPYLPVLLSTVYAALSICASNSIPWSLSSPSLALSLSCPGRARYTHPAWTRCWCKRTLLFLGLSYSHQIAQNGLHSAAFSDYGFTEEQGGVLSRVLICCA